MDVFWAAFGGGAAAGVVTLVAVIVGEYVRWRLDQPKLVVSMALGRIYTMEGTHQQAVQERYKFQKDETPAVILQAQNIRSHPVTITTLGYVAQKKGILKRQTLRTFQFHPQYTFGHKFPYTIPPGGSPLTQAEDSRTLLESLREAGFAPRDISYVWFKTATGRTFKGKPSQNTIELLASLEVTIARTRNDAPNQN